MLIGPPQNVIIRDIVGTLHVVGVSGGKDSSAMSLELHDRYPDTPFLHLCTPTGDEPDDMVAHWLHLGDLLGSRIWPVSCGLSLDGLIRQYDALPNWRQRWCTRQLKIEPYEEWLIAQANIGPVVSYIGLRADEPEREGGDYDSIPDVFATFPMREWGWGITEVMACLERNKLCIPRRTDCRRCYHQTLHEWYLLWAETPEHYADAEQQETDTGHTFRSPSRDTWPAALADMRVMFEAGRVPVPRKRVTACRVCSL
jgi:hypothetical protein